MRLTEQEARRRLESARVARLATVSADGLPHVVPVTFAVDGDHIYTAVDAKPKTTRDLMRLRNLRANSKVTVLADYFAEDWSQLWWARADGEASVLEDAAQIAGPIRLLASRYQQYRQSAPPGPVIAIRVERWTGWSAA